MTGPFGRPSLKAWRDEVYEVIATLPKIEPDEVRFHVYRIYGPGDILLYVGSSSQVETRLESHRRYSPFAPYIVRYETEEHPTKALMQYVEQSQIGAMRPLFNRNFNGWTQRITSREQVMEMSHAWLSGGLFGWWPVRSAA